MTYRLCRVSIFVLLAAVSFGLPASAATVPIFLPDAFGTVTATGGGGCFDLSASCIVSHSGLPTLTAFGQGQGGNSVSTITAGVPSAGAFANGSLARADASETYFFEIAGPLNAFNIPVSISGVVFTSIRNFDHPGSAGGAFAFVTLPGFFTEKSAVGNQNIYTNTPSHFFTDQVFLSSNVPYPISLTAGAGANTNSSSFAEALADPYIQIDMAWLAANPGYALEFSPGIVNAPLATPLPPTLQMFCTGVVALGAFAWWRRRSSGDETA